MAPSSGGGLLPDHEIEDLSAAPAFGKKDFGNEEEMTYRAILLRLMEMEDKLVGLLTKDAQACDGFHSRTKVLELS